MSHMIAFARQLYSMIPSRMRWIVSPLVFCVYWFQQLRLDLWIVDGEERNSGMPLSILCSAQYENKSFLLELIFGDTYRERYYQRAWLWNISKVIEKDGHNYSLMIAEVSRSHCKLLGIKNYFYIPSFVIGEVNIPIDPVFMNKKTIKAELSKIKKHEYYYEISRDPKCFFDFYHKMIVPTKTKLFGKTSRFNPHTPESKKNRELLLVKEQNNVVAGVEIAYDKYGPRLAYNGVFDGNLEYRRDGALAATYYFAFQYLEEKGYKNVNLGLSKPFIRNGALRHKTKWSQRIIGTEPNGGFILEALLDTAATRSFFCSNPFIFESRGQLNGAIFVDTEEPLCPEEFKRMDKDHFLPGLSKVVVYHFQANDMAKKNRIPPELSEHVILISAEDIFGLEPKSK
jgi:hypothetical protein